MPANSQDAPTFTTVAGPGAANSLYFSWDAGLVHYITLSTEMWFGTQSTDGKVNTTTMLKWLENDLIAANKNRANVPCTVHFDAAASDRILLLPRPARCALCSAGPVALRLLGGWGRGAALAALVKTTIRLYSHFINHFISFGVFH